jgi:hypothetical protein
MGYEPNLIRARRGGARVPSRGPGPACVSGVEPIVINRHVGLEIRHPVPPYGRDEHHLIELEQRATGLEERGPVA